MNTDTPETDSAYIQRPNEGAWDFRVRQEKTMEKLERERDEARAEMIRWQSIAEGRGRTDDDEQLAAVTEQRDRLAEALKEIYNVSSFDYATMPEPARKKYRQVVLEMADDALQSLIPNAKEKTMEKLEREWDEPETCIVCGGDEPCSHDFDAIGWPNEKSAATGGEGKDYE
jgi:hypothetical protein